MTPTSRGSVTEADRVALRNGVRKVLASTSSTSTGQSIFETELTDHAGDTDAAIDARLEEYGGGHFHPAGMCAIGKVVDGRCKVIGVDGMRVVDASVIPLPLGHGLRISGKGCG